MKKSRNDIDIEINNELNNIMFSIRDKAKEIIELADEVNTYLEYYNTLKDKNTAEEDSLFRTDIMSDLLEDIAYKMEKIK